MFEALSYWQKQLKNICESIDDKTITVKEMLDQLSKNPAGNYLQVELPDQKKCALAGIWSVDSNDPSKGFVLTVHHTNLFDPKSGQVLNNRKLIDRCKYIVQNNLGNKNIYIQHKPNDHRDLCGISSITCEGNIVTIHCIEQ